MHVPSIPYTIARREKRCHSPRSCVGTNPRRGRIFSLHPSHRSLRVENDNLRFEILKDHTNARPREKGSTVLADRKISGISSIRDVVGGRQERRGSRIEGAWATYCLQQGNDSKWMPSHESHNREQNQLHSRPLASENAARTTSGEDVLLPWNLQS